MEKGQTRKDQILMLESKIKSLSSSLSTLEAERSALSHKNAEGKMTTADYRRSAEVESFIRDFSSEKKGYELEVSRLRHEDIQEIERLTARGIERSAEAPLKSESKNSTSEKKNPEKKETPKGNGTRAGIFAIVAMLILVGVLAHKDKGVKTPSIDQMYEQEISDLASRTAMSEEEVKESLDGIQRMLYSGRLPKEEYLGDITYDYYVGKAVELFGMLGNPSNCINSNGVYYSVDHADWAEIESLKKFIEKYDVVYDDIARNLNEKNYEALEANIKKLADMQFDDFKMAGLNGGINPYGFKPQYRMAALLAATDRYSMVAEYALQNNVCFKPCLDLATGKKKSVNVFSMYEALMIDGGVSSNGKIVLDSFGTSFPKDQSLYDIFLNEGHLYFQAREDNILTRIIK